MALTERGNIRETLERYNKSPDRYTDKEKRNLLQIALAHKMDYKPESKPISKGVYSMLDMATLGLLMPDAWEPHSIGQEFYGETGIDKLSSGLGSLAGGAGAIGGAYLGAKAAYSGAKNLGSTLKSYWAKRRSQKVANSIMNNGKNTILEPQLGASQPQGLLGVGRGIGLNPRPQGLPPRPLGLPPRQQQGLGLGGEQMGLNLQGYQPF